MSRKKIVAGNWKMNMNLFEGKQLVSDIVRSVESMEHNEVQVIIAPPFTQLELAASQLKDKKNMFLGAQNCHHEAQGAYTGEVSASMLRSVNVAYVILGHSERRQYFGETETILAKKIDTVLKEGLYAIYCVGEQLEAREADTQNEVVASQLEALSHLDDDQMSKIVIAYEPVWAIGTGKTANAAQAQEMHAFIRNKIAGNFGQQVADNISILYGGSCNAQNAAELFSCPDVDGGLIGGASLKPQDFAEIIKARG